MSSLEEQIREVLCNYSCSHCGHFLIGNHRRSTSLNDGILKYKPSLIFQEDNSNEKIKNKKAKDSVKIETIYGDVETSTPILHSETLEAKNHADLTPMSECRSGVILSISDGHTVISHGVTPTNYNQIMSKSR